MTTEINSVIPRWNGRLESLDDYADDVRIYVNDTKKDERHLCGSRLIGVMVNGTSQKRLALTFNDKELPKEDGAQKLVQFFKEWLGDQAPIDLMKALVTYMYNMTRKKGETMVAYGGREEQLYHRLQCAFKRVMPQPEGQEQAQCLASPLRGVLLLYNAGLEPSESKTS